jgi:hypothetical protein
MTGAASALGIGKLAGKSDQPIMRVILDARLVVTGMANDATTRSKGMCIAKPVLFTRMTL